VNPNPTNPNRPTKKSLINLKVKFNVKMSQSQKVNPRHSHVRKALYRQTMKALGKCLHNPLFNLTAGQQPRQACRRSHFLNYMLHGNSRKIEVWNLLSSVKIQGNLICIWYFRYLPWIFSLHCTKSLISGKIAYWLSSVKIFTEDWRVTFALFHEHSWKIIPCLILTLLNPTNHNRNSKMIKTCLFSTK